MVDSGFQFRGHRWPLSDDHFPPVVLKRRAIIDVGLNFKTNLEIISATDVGQAMRPDSTAVNLSRYITRSVKIGYSFRHIVMEHRMGFRRSAQPGLFR
jgi:hypothetical protein